MKFKTPPLRHQQIEFDNTKDLPSWAYFHEMGVGKSKICIDIAAHLSDGVQKKILDVVHSVKVFGQLSDRLAHCAPLPAPVSGGGFFRG